MPGKYLAQNYLYRYRYAIGLYYFMYSTYLRTGTLVSTTRVLSNQYFLFLSKTNHHIVVNKKVTGTVRLGYLTFYVDVALLVGKRSTAMVTL